MPGENEADVAGHLAHRLIREGIVPVELRVAGDDRLLRYREPTFKAAPIQQRATISVVGRRQGLCAAVTRTVAFGDVPESVREAQQLAAMVNATCLYFSRPGEEVGAVFRRAKRIYEKFGHADEWVLDYQGCLTGYGACEAAFHPECARGLAAHQAMRWASSVQACRVEDTVVIDDRGYEVVTEAQNWPKLEIAVKGYTMTRPGILERPVKG
jgi:Xaa-Pro aminopeptidase